MFSCEESNGSRYHTAVEYDGYQRQDNCPSVNEEQPQTTLDFDVKTSYGLYNDESVTLDNVICNDA